jgi:hypothetical protein
MRQSLKEIKQPCQNSLLESVESRRIPKRKYPSGQEAHKERLENEGVEVIARGKKYQLVDSEKYLMKV